MFASVLSEAAEAGGGNGGSSSGGACANKPCGIILAVNNVV
jgi:hypothetical protein